MRGHEILLRTRDLIEEQGYQVIYGDTDSVFVLLGPLDDDVSANDIGQSLATDMNRQWEEYLRNEFDLPSYLEVEYETHFGRFLMPTVRGSDVGSKAACWERGATSSVSRFWRPRIDGPFSKQTSMGRLWFFIPTFSLPQSLPRSRVGIQ